MYISQVRQMICIAEREKKLGRLSDAMEGLCDIIEAQQEKINKLEDKIKNLEKK
jgi:archaellum component FlaC